MGVRREIEMDLIKNRRQEQGSRMKSLVSPVLISLLLISSHLVAAHGSASHREASCTVNVRPTLPPSPLHPHHLPTSCPSIQALLSFPHSVSCMEAWACTQLSPPPTSKKHIKKTHQKVTHYISFCRTFCLFVNFLTVLQNVIHQLGTSYLERGKKPVEKKGNKQQDSTQKPQYPSPIPPPLSSSYYVIQHRKKPLEEYNI